jgi:acetyl/propionyl-CoA carboxylase alpha subunit
MLGKVIAWGETRALAIERLSQALQALEIVGVTTNRVLLASVLADEEFQRGGVGTDFLANRQAQLRFGESAASDAEVALAAVWCATRRMCNDALWDDTRGWRLSAAATSRWHLGGRAALVESQAAQRFVVQVADLEHCIVVLSREAEAMRVELNGRLGTLRMVELRNTLHLFSAGRHAVIAQQFTDDALQASEGAEEGSLLTPLPGTVVAVHVKSGQSVEKGAPLITVEAMKMEHTLTAPYAGVVSRIAFGVSDRVAGGAVLVELQAT